MRAQACHDSSQEIPKLSLRLELVSSATTLMATVTGLVICGWKQKALDLATSRGMIASWQS
jgi:hypothetical protein